MFFADKIEPALAELESHAFGAFLNRDQPKGGIFLLESTVTH
jgi:hypothetical protein